MVSFPQANTHGSILTGTAVTTLYRNTQPPDGSIRET
jgi:hypothetical protein